jgi:hypothetical protein
VAGLHLAARSDLERGFLDLAAGTND